jgi:hypothetical protein
MLFAAGRLYARLGREAEAKALLGRSLKLREAIYGAESPAVAEALAALGGLKGGSAQRKASRALYARLLGPQSPLGR